MDLNALLEGSVLIPWRVVAIGIMALVAAIAFGVLLLLEHSKPRPSRRDRLDQALDSVWDREATEGIAPDTVEMFRASARVARLERIGGDPQVLLAELRWVELHHDRVLRRLVHAAAQDEERAMITPIGVAS